MLNSCGGDGAGKRLMNHHLDVVNFSLLQSFLD
jgi:hypothetical protein